MRAKIIETKLYKSGRSFTTKRMAETLGVKTSFAHDLLTRMAKDRDVVRDVDAWRKPYVHWIHRMRLADSACVMEEDMV
jgi:hypothetical protein